MFRRLLFAFLMWLSRKERRGYEEGYWRGWCNALYAIKSGEIALDRLPPPVEGTDKRKAYPVTAYAPSEQERHTDKIASTTTQQLPGMKFLNYLREKHSDEEAGPETKLHRAVQFPRPQ